LATEHPLALSDFGYDFPERLVAQVPLARRDAARLLVRDPSGAVRHRHVLDLTSELSPGTLLILNESRVIPSRLAGRLATGGAVEIFLTKALAPVDGGAAWTAMARPLKKLAVGKSVHFDDGVTATVVGKREVTALGSVDLAFDRTPEALTAWIDQNGYVPLPPYIHRDAPAKAPASADRERYQTVYAAERGSVAAPTAGLHFTDELMAALAAHGVAIARVALHVGLGTFLPVKTENLDEHAMHAETYRVPRATVEALLEARRQKRRVVPVGTTSLRSLESLYRRAPGDPDAMLRHADQWLSTDLFLRPRTADERIRPWVADGLMTNFHQPFSTLFMLIAALLGLSEARRVYGLAVQEEYRLFSYGDSSLLWL
jgi:S-adenosylmethionine:tRNA ribosyltransferase-isomerase